MLIDKAMLLGSMSLHARKVESVLGPDAAQRVLTEFGLTSVHKLADLNAIYSKRLSLIQSLYAAIIFLFPTGCAGYKISSMVASTMKGIFPTDKLESMCDEICCCKSRMTKESSQNASIASMLSVDISQLQRNASAGANGGVIFTDCNGKRYYIKCFFDDPSLGACGKIDPNEPFIYKLLELMQLGPPAQFLIRLYSTAQESVVRSNYIMTADVCNSEDNMEFFLDHVEHRPVFLEAMQSEEVNVALCVLSTLNDFALLGDTFGANPNNYGLVRRTDRTGLVSFGVMMVDHLPLSANTTFPPGRFGISEPYSPRTSIQKRVDSPRFETKSTTVAFHARSELVKTPLEVGRESFPRAELGAQIAARLAGLPEALERASQHVHDLILDYDRCFMQDAHSRLDSYKDIILANYGKYLELKM